MRRELKGIGHVVLHGVAGAHHVHVFEAGDGAKEGDLDFGGEAGAYALNIDFFTVPRFLLKEYRVTVLP